MNSQLKRGPGIGLYYSVSSFINLFSLSRLFITLCFFAFTSRRLTTRVAVSLSIFSHFFCTPNIPWSSCIFHFTFHVAVYICYFMGLGFQVGMYGS